MADPPGPERRVHPRYSPGDHFDVFTGAPRPDDAVARDQGPGGAFLPVRRLLPEGSLLILDVHEPEAVRRAPPVLLLAEVVYAKEAPVQGIGIRWKHALCLDGLDHLSMFLEAHFHLFLDPRKIGAFHREQLDGALQYDFHFGTLRPIAEETLEAWRQAERINDIQYPQKFLPKAHHIETRARVKGEGRGAPKPPAPGLPATGWEEPEVQDLKGPPVGFEDARSPARKAATPAGAAPVKAARDSVDEAQDATDLGFDDFIQEAPSREVAVSSAPIGDWAQAVRQRLAVKVPVRLLAMVGDETFPGVVRNVSTTHLLVLVDAATVFRKDRLVVRFPLSLGPISVLLVFVGTVTRIVRDRKSEQIGLDLTIDTVDEGGRPGIFREFVHALKRRLDLTGKR
ncbi:MAG: hypothetical protein FJ098_03540 [Deltaproteobacteria bacterium]|nr:hypothetical protein [Deltaproteobacteria bacterium]